MLSYSGPTCVIRFAVFPTVRYNLNVTDYEEFFMLSTLRAIHSGGTTGADAPARKGKLNFFF